MKTAVPSGPQLGSFPLDHYNECQQFTSEYFKCLQQNKFITPMCREEAKSYLQCRMDKGLMQPMDMEKFNMPKTQFVPAMHEKEKLVKDMIRQGVSKQQVGAYAREQGAARAQRDDGFEFDPATGQRVSDKM